MQNNTTMYLKYNDNNDNVDKVILWELYKKCKFDHANKWYMHNQESVMRNKTQKILWDFEIQTDNLIPARRPYLVIVNKRKENVPNSRLCRPGRPQCKNKNRKER